MEVLPPADQLMKNVWCQGIGMLRPLEVASVAVPSCGLPMWYCLENSKWWYWFGSIVEPCFDWCEDLVSAYFNYLEVYESREAGFVVKCPVELPCAPWCRLLSSWLKAWPILGAFCLPIRAFCVVFTHLRWIKGRKPLDVLNCVHLESWKLVSHWDITAHLITYVSFGRWVKA